MNQDVYVKFVLDRTSPLIITESTAYLRGVSAGDQLTISVHTALENPVPECCRTFLVIRNPFPISIEEGKLLNLEGIQASEAIRRFLDLLQKLMAN
tara:strand:+ start:169 stop:456 length:288 start_codon:yes stop_codon:yes gene_type:complete